MTAPFQPRLLVLLQLPELPECLARRVIKVAEALACLPGGERANAVAQLRGGAG